MAAEVGLPDRVVRAWLRWVEGRPDTARRVGPSPADQVAEIGRLRREHERLRMERDILTKAARICGQATGRR